MLPLRPGLWGRLVVLQVELLLSSFYPVFPYSCFESNLNGEYFTSPDDNGYYRGIVWELWLGDYSLKSAVMMVRPRNFSDSSSVHTSPVGEAPDP